MSSTTRVPLRLGIDLGGTKIEAVVLDEAGTTCWQQRIATPRGDYHATLAAMAALVQAAEQQLGRNCQVGVGGPGSLTPQGLLKNANSVWLNAKPIARDLGTLLQRELRYANDANCLAVSEATDGAAAGAQSVFGVILGTGVGGGLVWRGKLQTGCNGSAGEWGHNPLPWATEADPRWACWCGQHGCIETLLSGPGLARDHGTGEPGELVVATASAGQPEATATLQRYTHRLARALAGVINLVDPEVIVLGGGLSRVGSLYAQVPALWGQWVFSGGLKDEVRTRLVPAMHGDASGVRGAAWL